VATGRVRKTAGEYSAEAMAVILSAIHALTE